MPTVRAGDPHHGEVQTTTGPAAGVTVQTRQYTDSTFILTFMFPSYNKPKKTKQNKKNPKQSKAHCMCVVRKAFR